MLRRIPNPTDAVHSEEPPWERKKRGIPVIGIIPMVIPILTMTWKRSIAMTPAPVSFAKSSLAWVSILIPLRIIIKNSVITVKPPIKPHSSARIEKIKSVLCWGK